MESEREPCARRKKFRTPKEVRHTKKMHVGGVDSRVFVLLVCRSVKGMNSIDFLSLASVVPASVKTFEGIVRDDASKQTGARDVKR
jgi:hypothetical protein